MGFDKLLSFFTKNLQSNIVDDLYNKPVVVANHLYFDMNFIIYNSISNIEVDINNIYMLLFALPYTDINVIENKLNIIFNSFHWDKIIKSNNICFQDILDGDNITNILDRFKKIIDTYINDLLYWNIYNSLLKSITNNHVIQFIQTINLFFDGIPTFGKIVEQRRRRMKYYIDSKNRKKLFKKHFDTILSNIVTEHGITYDYFNWLEYLYSFSKSLGPHSDIMILLGDFCANNLKEEFPNSKIYLNNSTIDGESDYKIFKHMKDNKVDCNVVIHSCDSDFVFMIIWYQLLSNMNNVDINVMMINYIKTYNNDSEATIPCLYNTIISGKKIINLLLDKYNTINSINNEDITLININIIFDLLFILLMFGNDILPPSYELGSELNLKLLFETHYELYTRNNFVINLNSVNILNFTNLSKWLVSIKKRRSFSIIILSRFYRLPYNYIVNMTDKYDLDEIISNILIPYHIAQIKNESISMNQTDMTQIDMTQTDMTQIDMTQIDNMDFRKTLTSSVELTENYNLNEYIDVMNKRDCGLIRFEHGYDINNNSYQTLYNNIIHQACSETLDEFNRPYKIFFDNIMNATTSYSELTENTNVKEYLELLIYMSQIFFYNFDLYTPYSLFCYSDMVAPSIDMIVSYIATNNMNELQQSCYNNFNNKITYFNLISHHLFITPYLLDSTYIDSIKDDIEHIESLLNVISNNIPGIWYKESESFILKKIDPVKFITITNDMIKLYKDNLINIIFKKSSHLLK
jgi:hypothetical protein